MPIMKTMASIQVYPLKRAKTKKAIPRVKATIAMMQISR